MQCTVGGGEDFDVFVVWNIVFVFVVWNILFVFVVWDIVFVFGVVLSPGDKSESTAGGWEDASVTKGWGQVTYSRHHSVLKMIFLRKASLILQFTFGRLARIVSWSGLIQRSWRRTRSYSVELATKAAIAAIWGELINILLF